MICPYSFKKVVNVVQDTWEYDEQGNTKSHQSITTEDRVCYPCPKEGCGAYREGRCMYNVTSLDVWENFLADGDDDGEEEVQG